MKLVLELLNCPNLRSCTKPSISCVQGTVFSLFKLLVVWVNKCSCLVVTLIKTVQGVVRFIKAATAGIWSIGIHREIKHTDCREYLNVRRKEIRLGNGLESLRIKVDFTSWVEEEAREHKYRHYPEGFLEIQTRTTYRRIFESLSRWDRRSIGYLPVIWGRWDRERTLWVCVRFLKYLKQNPLRKWYDFWDILSQLTERT